MDSKLNRDSATVFFRYLQFLDAHPDDVGAACHVRDKLRHLVLGGDLSTSRSEAGGSNDATVDATSANG
jgi:hypothetical protein